jgi:hypothetical protein
LNCDAYGEGLNPVVELQIPGLLKTVISSEWSRCRPNGVFPYDQIYKRAKAPPIRVAYKLQVNRTFTSYSSDWQIANTPDAVGMGREYRPAGRELATGERDRELFRDTDRSGTTFGVKN